MRCSASFDQPINKSTSSDPNIGSLKKTVNEDANAVSGYNVCFEIKEQDKFLDHYSHISYNKKFITQKLIKDKYYTISFEAKFIRSEVHNDLSDTVTYRLGIENVGEIKAKLTSEWTKFVRTFKATKTTDYIPIIFYHSSNNDRIMGGDKFYFRDYKIEMGNKATTWTPTPFEYSNVQRVYVQDIDLRDSKYDENTWYPCVGSTLHSNYSVDGTSFDRISLSSFFDGAEPTWSIHDAGFTCQLEMLVLAHGWGSTYGYTICTLYTYSHCKSGEKSPHGYSQMRGSSKPVLWLRGGARYHARTSYNCSWSIKTEAFTENGNTVQPSTSGPVFEFDYGTIYSNIKGNYIPNIKSSFYQDGLLGQDIATGGKEGTSRLYKNALVITNPGTTNDRGWMRVTGTNETDTVLEIATGDDGREEIVARQYKNSNTPIREAKILDKDGNTKFPNNVQGKSFTVDKGDGISAGVCQSLINDINFDTNLTRKYQLRFMKTYLLVVHAYSSGNVPDGRDNAMFVICTPKYKNSTGVIKTVYNDNNTTTVSIDTNCVLTIHNEYRYMHYSITEL